MYFLFASNSFACSTVPVPQSEMTSSSLSFSRIFLDCAKNSLIIFSAFLILRLSSDFRLWSYLSLFFSEIDKFFLISFLAPMVLSFIKTSSSIGGLVKWSGIFFGSHLLAFRSSGSPSKFRFFSGFQTSLGSRVGDGWMTAKFLWEYFGIYLKLSNSLAFDTL